MNVSISRNSLFDMLSGMSLADRRWLANRLTEQVRRDETAAEEGPQSLQERSSDREAEFKELYASVFASFNKDWGGDGDAVDIARELRNEAPNTRTIGTW